MGQSSAPRRRPNTMRHTDYNYTDPGAYFVTICTHRGQCVLGQVTANGLELNVLGELAKQAWYDWAANCHHVKLDAMVIMPNHVHALIWIAAKPEGSLERGVSTARDYGRPIAGSLSTLINAYKTTVTKRAIRTGLIPGPPLWQRNFWDRIVSSDSELSNIRRYIEHNPARWLDDQLHPSAPPNWFDQTYP